EGQQSRRRVGATVAAGEEEGLAGSCSRCNREDRRKGAAGREEMGYRSASLAVRCDIAGPISAKQRKKRNRVMVTLFRWMRSAVAIAGARRKKRFEEEGCDQDLSFVNGKQRMWVSGDLFQ
ncbi:hypothetical protein BHM03_00040967, partial [Ensete ventricosum]